MSAAPERVLLLTGAAGRLGEEFCRTYAGSYRIVAVHRGSQPPLPTQNQRLVDPLEPGKELPANRHPLFTIRADLTREGEIQRVVELVLARFERIDVVVNAAVHSVWGPVVARQALLDSVDAQFATNTMLPLRLAAEVARRYWHTRRDENLRANRCVVNVSSTAGLNVYRGQGQSVYSATKAALNFLTCHLADEFEAFGVRVNATAPNAFPTIVPIREVVRSIARLADGDMNGRILVVDRAGEELL